MASGKSFGSTATLHAVGGDTIPKEYHRRVLKKIAQLTKVVYSLHTKNDESEEQLETLTSEHLKEKQRLESERDVTLRERNEERIRNQDLEKKIADLEKDKSTLFIEHGSFIDTAEKRLQVLAEENSKSLLEVSSEVSHLKEQLTAKEKECSSLQEQLSVAADEHCSKESSSMKEIDLLKQQNQTVSEDFKQNLQALKTDYEHEVAQLTKKHKEEMKSLQDFIANERDSATQFQLQQMEDKYKLLETQAASKEASLQDKLSCLSAELKQTRDELAISQQRERQLEIQLKEKTSHSQEDKDLLAREKELVLELQQKMKFLEEELLLMKEARESQNDELKKIAAHAGELEAMKMHLEKDSSHLRLQLKEAVDKLKELEERRKVETEGYRSSSDETTQRVHSLEKEVEKLSQEKRHLHAQYAREIEAAHSCLSDNETALNEKHADYIRQIVNQHQNEIEVLKAEKEKAANALIEDYESRLSVLESSSSVKYHDDMEKMSTTLNSKVKELSELRKELDSIHSLASERDRQLKTADASIDKLKEELMAAKQEAAVIKREKDTSEIKLAQLQLSLDALRTKYDQSLIAHQREMIQTEIRTRNETEEVWKKRMMTELSTLRNELESQYCESRKSALNKMAQLKDSVFKESEAKWRKENEKLLQQIKLLEKELEDRKFSSEAGLLQLKTQCQQEMDELNYKHCQQLKEADLLNQELISNHVNEMKTLRNTLEGEKQKAVEELSVTYQREILETRQANQLATEALRSELLKKGERERENMKDTHQQQLETLQCKLKEDTELKLEEVRLQYDSECKSTEKMTQKKMDALNLEVLECKSAQASLETQLSSCREELSMMKQKLTLLNIELNDKRKHLEMKEQEIQTTLTEARNELKFQEEQISAAHRAEMESLICQHKHQSRLIINEFNKAKEILTKKLSIAEKRLHEAEMRYKNREPRPEDLAMIKKLQLAVKEQERKMKEILMEKKVYQMELVNREKNYNRVFNANPQVGVLDPLKGKKKTAASTNSSVFSPSAMRFSSAPDLVPTRSEVNSLPSISSISAVDYRDYHQSPQLSRFYQSPSSPSLKTTLNHAAPIQNNHDVELPGLILSPSPKFHLHGDVPSGPTPVPHPAGAGKRPIKFLSDRGNELLPERTTNPKNTGIPLQASFTSISNSILA